MEQAQPWIEPRKHPMRPSRALIARVLGGVLCLAAALKALDLLASPTGGIEAILSVIGASVELIVGAGLVSRAWPDISMPAGGLLFVLMAGASLIGTSRGVANCGCLGRVAMPPWIMLGFDVGAAVALLWGPRAGCAGRPNRALALDAACIGVFFTGLAIGSALYPRLGPTATAVSPESLAAASTVVIDPDRLQGRPFFLHPYIRIDADLSRGEWKIILARHGCPRCEQRLRSGGCRPEGEERVAVIMAEERASWTPPRECEAVLGSLSRDKTWLFEAPLVLRVIGGRVAEVRPPDRADPPLRSRGQSEAGP
jgi:hypothetical protein